MVFSDIDLKNICFNLINKEKKFPMFLTLVSIRNEEYFINIACLEQENRNRAGENSLCSALVHPHVQYTHDAQHSGLSLS